MNREQMTKAIKLLMIGRIYAAEPDYLPETREFLYDWAVDVGEFLSELVASIEPSGAAIAEKMIERAGEP